MEKLSTGDDSTIESYLKISKILFGAESKPVQYLEDLAAKSPNGKNEEIIQHETQVLHLLGTMFASDPRRRT